MQEDIERRSVAIVLTASKFTGHVLAKCLGAVARKIQTEIREGKTPQGKQSWEKLMNHGVPTSTLPLDGETKTFDRVAREYNVDYAFRPVGPGKYLLLFKSGQADAITVCFSEYAKRITEREADSRSIAKQLERFGDMAKSKPQAREHERIKEVLRDDR